jgi:magnesium chelatase family protein
MLAKVPSCAVVGLEGALVEVEVDLSNGLAGFMIVGLPDTAVNEAKDRVRAAIKNSGCLFPYKRITVNLAPADLRKEGPAYDLPGRPSERGAADRTIHCRPAHPG